MTTEYKPGNNQIAVRYSRVLKLPWAIALGSGVTVGLGVFVLLSLILSTAGNNSVKTYGLLALVFLPIARTGYVISRLEGALLLTMYVVIWILVFH